jgi:hypothetical protein
MTILTCMVKYIYRVLYIFTVLLMHDGYALLHVPLLYLCVCHMMMLFDLSVENQVDGSYESKEKQKYICYIQSHKQCIVSMVAAGE